MRKELKNTVEKAIKKLQKQGELSQFDIEDILFERPTSSEHGDWSTNIALIIAKKVNGNPRKIAEQIVLLCKAKDVEKCEVAGPGFINFFISPQYFQKELAQILKQKDSYGMNKEEKGKKVMIEFTDPNPFKEFHIGHLYSNIVGESLSRLFEANGSLVKRANYQGDVGMHVAKAIFGMQQKMKAENMAIKELEKKSLGERIKFMGQAYAYGDAAFENNEQSKKEITELNKKIFALAPEIKNLYEKGRKWSLDYFEEIYKLWGTKFDFYYFEREVGKAGEKLVRENISNGVFQESEGAIIFPGEKYGFHDRVFINSQGLPTYEAKELGLAPRKYKDFKYDLSIIITGNEITEYFKVLLVALKEISPDLGNKTRHLSHGIVRLPTGKMSSRTGTVISAEKLLDEVSSRVLKLMESLGNEIAEGDRENTVKAIALGAVKYSLLRVSLGKDIVFDFDKSLSIQGNSGPYIQYTYARCKSILRKAKVPTKQQNFKGISKEELDIIRLLIHFPEQIKEAAERFSPNLLCSFVFTLAQAYNSFYNTKPVLQAETEEAKEFRLVLTSATAQVIKNCLSLLGITVLERM